MGVEQIYLDFNASTPIAPEVSAAMTPLLTTAFGNPSSAHWAGQAAKEALERARTEVADLIRVSSDEIVFTSGGTEANNAAIKGVFFRLSAKHRAPHIITTAIEHPAVLEPCAFLESLGARVSRLPVDGAGLVDPADVRDAITPETVLVSVMHANNEVGSIQPIAEIAEILHAREILFHTDAAQSLGKIPVLVDELGVDMLSVAGHKLYAPKGVGALYVRSGLDLEPLMHGAGHERGRRAGTESTLLAVGLGAACRLAVTQPCTDQLARVTRCFWERLKASFGSRIVLNGDMERRLPNTLNVSLLGHDGQQILDALGGLAASTGSACHTGSRTMSPVLAAMGCEKEVGLGAIRFSVGRQTTTDEVNAVVDMLTAVVQS